MPSIIQRKAIVMMTAILTLAACGGGSDDPGTGTVNRAPTANAGTDQSVDEFSNVALNGSASSDPDAGTTLTYTWSQTAGTPTVTIVNSDMAQASFDAPDVMAASPQTLTFQLTVSDGSLSNSDTVDVLVSEPLTKVTVAGVLSFEFVLPNNNCFGLNLNNPVTRPIRGATVQLLDSSNNVLGEMTLGPEGSVSFSNIDSSQDVRLRVRAELKSSGPAVWDVEVRDNVDTSPIDTALPCPFSGHLPHTVDHRDAALCLTTRWCGRRIQRDNPLEID